jgi:ADP-heptose:LPS heptosyltransferase
VDDDALAAFDRYQRVLDHLSVPRQGPLFDLPRPALSPLLDGIGPRSYVVLHPYSRWKTKLWPWRNYEQLIARFPDQLFVIIGQGSWFPVRAPHVIDLRNAISINDLSSILAHAKAIVSTDSGPAHLAAAHGVPTLALFGATDWRRTSPVGPAVRILQHDVFCSPCLKRNCHHPEPMACLTGLSPQQVASELKNFLV